MYRKSIILLVVVLGFLSCSSPALAARHDKKHQHHIAPYHVVKPMPQPPAPQSIAPIESKAEVVSTQREIEHSPNFVEGSNQGLGRAEAEIRLEIEMERLVITLQEDRETYCIK